VVTDRTAVYLSAPITTGHRFSVWRSALQRPPDEADPEYRANHLREVIEPNRREVERLVTRLRQRHAVVMYPTAFPDVSGWTPSDYRVVWAMVIEHYAAKVVFAEGWQYSNGCAYEYLISLRSNAEALDASERLIEPTNALGLLRRAVRELDEHGTSPDFLNSI